MAHDLKLWPWFEAASETATRSAGNKTGRLLATLGKPWDPWATRDGHITKSRRPNSFFGIPGNSSSGRIHWISTQDSFDATAAQLLLSPAPCWQAHRKLGMDLETCALETGYQYLPVHRHKLVLPKKQLTGYWYLISVKLWQMMLKLSYCNCCYIILHYCLVMLQKNIDI